MSTTKLRRFPSKFYLSSILIFLFFLDAFTLWFVARTDYKNTLDRTRISLEKAAISLEERVRRTIISAEATLDGRAIRIQEKGIRSIVLSKQEWERFRTAADGLSDAGSLWLLDHEARLLSDSTTYPSPQIDFSGREYFIAHRDLGTRFYIGPVVKGRITGKYSFTISRRLESKDGRFLGIIVAAIDTDDFANFMRNVELDEESTVIVFRTDGALILRQPMSDEFLGKDFKHLKLFSIPFDKELSGSYEARATGGIKRFIAYRKIDRLPLVVAATTPLDPIVKGWRERLKVYSLIALVFFFVLLGFSWLVRRTTTREEREKTEELSVINRSLQNEINERKRAEGALLRSMERLDIISETANQLLFSTEPRKMVETLCRRVMEHLDCEVFLNFLVDEEMKCLRLNAYAGIEEEIANSIHFLEYGETVCGCAARDACRIVAENISASSDIQTGLIRSLGITAYFCHPLLVQEQVIGTLSFGTRSRSTFAEDELSLMKIVADQVATAMDRIRLLRLEKERADELELQIARRTVQLKQQAELLNVAQDAIILTDIDGKIIFWSTGAENTYGFSQEESIGSNIYDLLQTESQVPIRDIIKTVKHEGRWEGELIHTCKEGRKATIHSKWILRQNEVDGILEIMEVNRDITSRKQVEEAVKEERERLYSVLETLPAYVVLLTRDYRMPFANRIFRELFGDPEDRQCFHHLFGRTGPCEGCETYKTLKTIEPQRWLWTGPDGHIYDIHDFPFTDADGSTLILEMGIDVTDRKRAEEEVRLANAYNRSLIEASLDPLVTISADGRIMDVNEATEKVTGCARLQLIGTDFSDYFTSPERAKAGYEQVFKEGLVRDYELEIRHSSGHVTPVLYNATLYRDETRKVLGVFAAARDISALRNAEQALRESEERYRIAIESASDGIALVVHDLHVFVNRRFAEIFGYEGPSEIVGKPLSITVHPDDLNRVLEINKTRQEGKSAPARYEFKGLKKDGTLRIIEVSAVRTTYLGESASLSYLRDITEYKNLEAQLRHSQKMEAIGTLAGGIAHDFNNILAAIIGFAEMIEEDIPQGRPKLEHVQRVIRAASRGRELVQQILAFSRKTEHARKPVSVASLARETVQLLRASTPTTIDILLDIAAVSDTILATPVEVQQVFMNLITNAALSMNEKGGMVHVSITDVNIEPDSPILNPDMGSGEYLRVVVSDTGSGMTPDVMERIFDPFFTTREVGQGSGMGLAVVYGIVKSLHGKIEAESEPGVGSTFSIFFPKAEAGLSAEETASEQAPGNSERVLFIDDEKFLVEWGQAQLERIGYEVTALDNSVVAFEIFLSDPSGFDLVITDQTMPGMTGLDLAREIYKIRPDMPVILCTGHSDVVTTDIMKEAGIKEFLMKPLTKKELLDAIQRVLHKEEYSRKDPEVHGTTGV